MASLDASDKAKWTRLAWRKINVRMHTGIY